jgi:hypothetical protein
VIDYVYVDEHADTRKGVIDMADTTKTLTPTQLATSLAGADNAAQVAKAFVRPFLRKNFARAKDAKGTSWYLTAAQVKAVKEAYAARVAGKA